MSASLKVEGATVHFGDHVALAAADLDAARGEVITVVGPSGSGKSTLLRAIAGLQPLQKGRVLVDGHDLSGAPPHQRRVGLMFQDHALFPHKDVKGNIAFGLRMQRLARAEVSERVGELLELVDLAGFGDRRIQTLSGGEQQRVALARALAPRPEVLLLDEPLGALDRTLRDRLVFDLRRLFTALDLTVVAVTHDQAEAYALADRIAVMDGGTVLQMGSPAEIWERPKSGRVAALLGFRNILEVEVSAGRAVTPWGEVAVDAPDGGTTILVRASGVRLDAAAPSCPATAVTCVFIGDRTLVNVEAAGAPVHEALVPTDQAPRPGDTVRIAISPESVVSLGA